MLLFLNLLMIFVLCLKCYLVIVCSCLVIYVVHVFHIWRKTVADFDFVSIKDFGELVSWHGL